MYGRGCSAGCEDNFDCHEVTASAFSGYAGRCEDTFDDSVQASENSVVARVAACSGRELDVTSAAARCGENNCNGHLLEFKNSLLAAESGYSLHCLHSLNSFICHPSMHAPSLASELFDGNDVVVGVGRFREGCSWVARWLGTARVDALLHAGIQSVSACPNSFIGGHTECHGSPCSQMDSSPNSRLVRGPGLCGRTKDQVRQGAGERPAFAQQLSGRVHVGTWAGGHNCLNLRISQEKEIISRCAVSGSSPRIPFVTPVLPGPGSDIWMKMGWKVLDKTRKSGVWFFWDAGVWLGSEVWPILMGAVDFVRKGSYHTAWAVPCGSLCTCSYAYGRGPPVGPHTGERCGDCTRALLGTAMMSRCLGWAGCSKLIVSVSFGSTALFKWKGKSCPDIDINSCYLGHGDILVMDGQCQDEFLHCTDPGLEQERINVTFRWIKQHVASCSFLRTGVACCLPTCARGFSF